MLKFIYFYVNIYISLIWINYLISNNLYFLYYQIFYDIDTYVICTGDVDFSPLILELKKDKKNVIGMSNNRNSTSNTLPNICDKFIYLQDNGNSKNMLSAISTISDYDNASSSETDDVVPIKIKTSQKVRLEIAHRKEILFNDVKQYIILFVQKQNSLVGLSRIKESLISQYFITTATWRLV